MGICYKLILEDEWDFAYSDLKTFEEKWGSCLDKVAEWDSYKVYDIDKRYPYPDSGKLELIREVADRAYTISDLGDGIKKLDLPAYKPSVKAELDNLNGRRTAEEKKASEDLVRKKLEIANEHST